MARQKGFGVNPITNNVFKQNGSNFKEDIYL